MTQTVTKAEIGTISHATLRVEDLIDAFASTLDRLIGWPNPLSIEADRWLTDDNRDQETGDYILEDLFDALDKLAPPDCYFGAHEGDASDFGFWPIDDRE